MDRLRRFLSAGVTCFVDLTEPWEFPSYEALLPFATPDGRRVEYLREPIPDHGVPASRETMSRVLAMLDDALEAGHVVYVHCRAGVGRSAMVAGCWLASRPDASMEPLDRLQQLWQQCAKAEDWTFIPETEDQAQFVRDWSPGKASAVVVGRPTGQIQLPERVRGALFGLAAGDAAGASFQVGHDERLAWTQHTALALCLAESLLETGQFDARDQMERYVRWQRDGYMAAGERPPVVTPDVARALATYHWRGQPMAGSHDPRDRSTASLPRVVPAVMFALADSAGAVALAGECSRTTHQSPVVIDACRYYAAMLVGALRGAPVDEVLGPLYEPAEGLWDSRPLKAEVAAMAVAAAEADPGAARVEHAPDAVRAVANARAAVAGARDFDDAVQRACNGGIEPALDAALAGALMGALFGERIIAPELVANIARAELLESVAARMCAHLEGPQR
jgi:ADP-ribosylglycohydrolase